jgi:hypothetical protein
MKQRITRYAMGLSILCLVACMGCESYAELKARDHFVEDEEFNERCADSNHSQMFDNKLHRSFMAEARKKMGYANAYVLWWDSFSTGGRVFFGVLRRDNELFAMTATDEGKFAFVGPLEDKRLLGKFKWLIQNKRDIYAMCAEGVAEQSKYRPGKYSFMLFARDSSGDIVSHDIAWNLDLLDWAIPGEFYNIADSFDGDDPDELAGYQYDVRLLRHAKRLADWYYGACSLLDAVHLEYAEKMHTSLGSIPYRADKTTSWREFYIGYEEDRDAKRAGRKSRTRDMTNELPNDLIE